MKALRYILYGLVIAGAAGLLIYQGLIQKNLDSGDLTKGILIIAAAIVAMIRPRQRKQVGVNKSLYQKAYPQYIGNAFSQDKKLENTFYTAVALYNQDKPNAAVAKLEKLRGQCSQSDDYYALIVFSALCYDDMRLYDKAIEQYEKAIQMRQDSTLASNLGLCYDRKGKTDQAIDAYLQAIQWDSSNFTPYNNMAQLCIRIGDYNHGLQYASQAVALNQKMPQALNAMTICHYMLGNQAEYERYYRQAVSCGSDPEKLKKYLKSLDPSL